MFLYELAIELGERSPDLVDAAAALGMGELLPASQLTAEQVAALKGYVAQRGPRPGAGGPGSAPPLPAVPTGPLVAGPPAAGDPATAPTAPASWGPPTAPASWGPPVAGAGGAAWGAPAAGQAAPPTPPPPPTAPGGVPAFQAPTDAIAAPSPPPVGLEGVGLPPSPPTAWAAPGNPGGGPVGPTPGAPDDGGLSKGQIGAIAAAVLVVVALFGFMIANTGPDEDREAAIAAEAEALEAANEAAASTTTTTEAEESTTTSLAADVYEPRDLDAFCRGGLAVATFELRLVAAIVDQDLAEMKALVRERRATWQDDVGVLASGAPPINVDDIELYQSGYNELFDTIESASSMEQVTAKTERIEMFRASNAGQEWGRLVTFHCE